MSGAGPFRPQNCPETYGDLDPYLILGSLGPPESTSWTASWSVEPFLHSLWHRPYILQWAAVFPGQNCPFTWCIWTIHGSRPMRVHNPNGISICSPVFAGLTIVWRRDQMTDHATSSVIVGFIYVVLQCGLIIHRAKWRHISVFAIRSPFYGAMPSYCA